MDRFYCIAVSIIENPDASEVILTEEEFTALEAALNQCRVFGHRWLGGL